jgi:hypothetical protein
MHSVGAGSKAYIKNLQNDSNKDIVTTHTKQCPSVSMYVRQENKEQKTVKKFLRHVYWSTKEITDAQQP